MVKDGRIKPKPPRWNKDIVDRLNDFPVVMVTDQWLVGSDLHYQPGLEIHLTLEGSGAMVVGRRVFPQFPRSVLLFRGNTPHQMISKGRYKRRVICLNLGESEPLPANVQALRYLVDCSWIPVDGCLGTMLSPPQFRQVDGMCRLLQYELERKETGWECMAVSLALQLSVYLQRVLQKSGSPAAWPGNRQPNELVRHCSDYVCGHLGERLTLKEMAKRFAASEEHLTRCFKKETGISFYQYVIVQRVAEAKRLLLAAPDMSIAEIAELTGFPSPSAFGRHFKLLLGMRPSELRRGNAADAAESDR
ncbi:AraC family transcriptional regulator [Paenibacillus hemerocallicola]|nr:AraC family transcriptional regulator [Paenibacillus hemerocallicola]